MAHPRHTEFRLRNFIQHSSAGNRPLPFSVTVQSVRHFRPELRHIPFVLFLLRKGINMIDGAPVECLGRIIRHRQLSRKENQFHLLRLRESRQVALSQRKSNEGASMQIRWD